LLKEIAMKNATMDRNERVARKSLGDQIDRLDGILDGLAEALNESVADAVRNVVGQVVRQAVEVSIKEVLASPDLSVLLSLAMSSPSLSRLRRVGR
jgi:hypothetical protein